jgi:hypothetical protein
LPRHIGRVAVEVFFHHEGRRGGERQDDAIITRAPVEDRQIVLAVGVEAHESPDLAFRENRDALVSSRNVLTVSGEDASRISELCPDAP